MRIIHTVKELQAVLKSCRDSNQTIGLVPTMGALHAGHASLVQQSVSDNEVSVVSVFVNPTQFNDKEDLDKYPRTFEQDCQLLQEKGVDIVFSPTEQEMYPEPDTRTFSYPPLDTVMEGQFRPGHFNGVCQIVSKLFTFVQPDRVYFGEKDFQQLAIVRRMAKELFPNLEVIGCPIVREPGGLALSSRNARLTDSERQEALTISKVLFQSVDYAKNHSVQETQQFVEAGIAANPALELEYFELVDGTTLQSIQNWDDTAYAVGCITVYCGADQVRLIDHITYKK